MIIGLIEKVSREFKLDPKTKKPRILVMPQLDFDMSWGYFDGANLGHSPRMGINVILYLNVHHYFFMHYIARRGSNMKAKFGAM